MDEKKEPAGTRITDKAKRQAEDRQRRLAAALRANLGRRKAQSRARDAGPDPADPDKQES